MDLIKRFNLRINLNIKAIEHIHLTYKGEIYLRYLLAIFVFASTASDIWVDMFRSAELGETSEVHLVKHTSDSHSTPKVLASHDHENTPCTTDGCTDCHTCHFGHCSILIPKTSNDLSSALSTLVFPYVIQAFSVSLDGLYRPPKSLTYHS